MSLTNNKFCATL